MKAQKRISLILFFNFLWLLAFLICIEIVLRFFGLGYDSAAFEPHHVYHHVHKKNYTFINDNPSENEYNNVLVRYDRDGCVSNPQPDERALPSKKIAILGDSFAEGLQVSFNNSLTGILEKTIGKNYQIKNFAVGGYSPVVYFLQCKNIVNQYKPDYVLLFLYSNDVHEDNEYLQHAVYKNNSLAAVDGGMPAWKYALIRNSYLLRMVRKYYIRLTYFNSIKNDSDTNYAISNTLEEKPLLTSPTTNYLDSIKLCMQQLHCKLIITAIPSKYKTVNAIEHDRSDFATQTEQWASQNGVDYINLVSPFAYVIKNTGQSAFFKNDIHFNEVGHSVAGVTIANYFKKQ